MTGQDEYQDRTGHRNYKVAGEDNNMADDTNGHYSWHQPGYNQYREEEEGEEDGIMEHFR